MFPCTLYSWHWSCFEKAGLDVLKPLLANDVDEEEGMLTNAVTLVIELSVSYLPLCRVINCGDPGAAMTGRYEP